MMGDQLECERAIYNTGKLAGVEQERAKRKPMASLISKIVRAWDRNRPAIEVQRLLDDLVALNACESEDEDDE